MIDTLSPHRPGLAAIAAVLALSSTPALAQVALPEAPSDSSTSISAPEPQAPTPAASAQTLPTQAPAQTVQSLPPTAPPLPELVMTPSRPAKAPAAAARSERTNVAATPTIEKVRQPVGPGIDAAAPVAPSTAPIVTDATPSHVVPMEPIAPAPVATTTVQPASSGGMDYAGWVLLGGGLLLVAGGATFAMTRRPRRHADDDVDATSNGSTGAIPVSAPLATAPVTPFVEPTRPAAVIEPQSVRAPSMARQPNLDFASDDRIAVLEAMIAEAPSEANPFHSRRNRLRRADFLLRTGQAGPEVRSAPVRSDQVAPARDRWTQMSFGGQRATRLSWKPVTNR